jgi:hypothetical protein
MADRIDKESLDYVIGQIETKLESQEVAAKERHTEVMVKLTEHNERINRLERIKHWAVGGAAVGSSGGLAAWWHKLIGTGP